MFFDSERERNEVEEKMTLILFIDFKTKEIQDGNNINTYVTIGFSSC